jgi:hypothetical protein
MLPINQVLHFHLRIIFVWFWSLISYTLIWNTKCSGVFCQLGIIVSGPLGYYYKIHNTRCTLQIYSSTIEILEN